MYPGTFVRYGVSSHSYEMWFETLDFICDVLWEVLMCRCHLCACVHTLTHTYDVRKNLEGKRYLESQNKSQKMNSDVSTAMCNIFF